MLDLIITSRDAIEQYVRESLADDEGGFDVEAIVDALSESVVYGSTRIGDLPSDDEFWNIVFRYGLTTEEN